MSIIGNSIAEHIIKKQRASFTGNNQDENESAQEGVANAEHMLPGHVRKIGARLVAGKREKKAYRYKQNSQRGRKPQPYTLSPI